MLVVFVHGWGVRHADYGTLPQRLPQSIEVWLSEYISYSDSVTIDDLADAFERARLASFPNQPFACITHSTGGPVILTWLDRHHGPLTHLIMLAPPLHGSALAQLGKGRLSRMKSWMEGVEPGQCILDFLELGSGESRKLRLPANIPCAVITGATPDRSLYDHLNSYTGEHGSDGVVRIAAANPNYSLLRLEQSGGELLLRESHRTPPTPFIVLPGVSHSGILRDDTPLEGPRQPASMAIFKANVDDFDLLLTSGPQYSPDALPRGFFIDRQRNSLARNTLTYYVNYAALATQREFGFIIEPRPFSGPIHFSPAEFRGELLLRPDETTLIEITLERHIEPRVFALTPSQNRDREGADSPTSSRA